MTIKSNKYIVSPVLDFLLLGGASLILFPLIMFIWPEERIHAAHLAPIFFAAAAFFTFVVNSPHFIYSYVLLYKDFPKKFNGEINEVLQGTYIFASVVLPLALMGLMAFSYFKRDYMLWSLICNVGILLNGWHYAKQGFGILIVTSVYQKIYYTSWERRILLWNANILWIYVWVLINTGIHRLYFWTAKVHALLFPPVIQHILFYLVCLGALLTIMVFIRKYIVQKTAPPLSGITAYVTSIYFWLIFLNASFLFHFHPVILLIPGMHAIQYNTIVFKMKQNEIVGSKTTIVSVVIFVAVGIVLGFLAFNVVPAILDRTFNMQNPIDKSFLFAALVAVFISIHHFFIDSVIWRKENGEVKSYLYGIH